MKQAAEAKGLDDWLHQPGVPQLFCGNDHANDRALREEVYAACAL
jgi:Zn-dependent oligopeptidase